MKDNTLIGIDENLEFIGEDELCLINGGAPHEYAGFYVSFVMGPTYHAAWMVGYAMGRFL